MSASGGECANCGKTFALQGKSYRRTSFQSKVKAIDRTIKDVIEEEFRVSLTPGGHRFMCTSCCLLINTLAKSSEARKTLQETGDSSYLKRKLTASFVSTKISSPTPRKIKRQRILSPKTQSSVSTVAKSDVVGVVVKEKVLKKKKKSVEAEVVKGLNCLRRRQYSRGISILLQARLGFKKALVDCMKKEVRKEITLYATPQSTFKGAKTLDEVSTFSWENVFNELMEKCPFLTNILVASLTKKHTENILGVASKPSTSVKPVLGSLAAVIMYMRKPTLLYGFQEMNSLQLWLSGTKREMFARLNHLGLSIGVKGTRSAIDRIRTQYDSVVLQWKTKNVDFLSGLATESITSDTIPYVESADATDVESDLPTDSPMVLSPRHLSPTRGTLDAPKVENKGKFGYSICFDNVNTKVTVRHQTRDRQNKMFNMVQAYAARDRIPTLHFSDQAPTPEDLLEIPLSVYFPSEMDEVTLRSEMTVMVTRVLSKYLIIFQGLQPDVTHHITHRYSKQSSSKSEMVPLGVLDKDECKLADTIDILEEYHKYVPLKPNGDPLTIPLHADGLSCERGNDAQCARMNGINPWAQLQGLVMNVQEWHKRCILLQDIYDDLYGSCGRDKGTLFHLKNFFNHRNVTTNVKQSFNYNEEFLEFCGDGYIVLCAMHCLGMNEISSIPEDFPEDRDEQWDVLNSVSSQVIDMVFVSSQYTVQKIVSEEESENNDEEEYCICGLDLPGQMVFCQNRNCQIGWFHLDCMDMTDDDVTDNWFCSDECEKEKSKKRTKKTKKISVAESLQDRKKNYVLRLIWMCLNQKVRRDAIRENDGERMIMHWKFDMLQFYEKKHPKYFLLGQRLLAAVHGAVSPRLQHTLKWNRTVNPHGGKGTNIAMDLQMEFFNKEFKESVKDAAGHLTEATIARHSQMIGIGKVLKKIYDIQVSGLSGRNVHKSDEVKRDKDLSEFVDLLTGEDLFTAHPGRSFTSFPNISTKLYPNIIAKNVRARLQKHTKLMSKKLKVVMQMQRN